MVAPVIVQARPKRPVPAQVVAHPLLSLPIAAVLPQRQHEGPATTLGGINGRPVWRLLAREEEDNLFHGIVTRAVEAALLPKRAVQVMDSSRMLGSAAVQDTYKLLRRALHRLVKGCKRELPAALMPRLKRYLQTGKADIDWEDREARQYAPGKLRE